MTLSNILSEIGIDFSDIGILIGAFIGLIFWKVSRLCVNHMAFHLYSMLWSNSAHTAEKSDFVAYKNGNYWALIFFSDLSDDAYMRFATIAGGCAASTAPLSFVLIAVANEFERNSRHLIVIRIVDLLLVMAMGLIFLGSLLANIYFCFLESPRFRAIKAGISTEEYAELYFALTNAYEPSTASTSSMTDFSCYPDDSSFYEANNDSSAAMEATVIENMALLSE
jgi:hypothetical protein